MKNIFSQNIKTKEFVLYSKGAHEKIIERCSEKYPEIIDQVDMFASFGLRVMALSFKTLNEEMINEIRANIKNIKD